MKEQIMDAGAANSARRPTLAGVVFCDLPLGTEGTAAGANRDSVSKVEMVTPTALIYKILFPSISTFETPPISSVSMRW
jgi:hypothetical protein